MQNLPDIETSDLPTALPEGGQWHLVWDWWPVPRFIHSMLGAEQCESLVKSIYASQSKNRMLVFFALELEYRQLQITSESDLEAALTKICGPGYDFAAADALQREVASVHWERISQERENALARFPLTPDNPVVLKQAIEAKNLPTGRQANLKLIRSILCGDQDR